MHDKLIEAMREVERIAYESAGWGKPAQKPEWLIHAPSVVALLLAARPDVAAVLRGEAVAVPREADEVIALKMREAFRSSRRGGISGMSLDAQFRSEFAPEIAAYSAAVAASPYTNG